MKVKIFRRSLVLVMLIVFVGNGLLLSACKPVHPQIQDFARDLVKQVKTQVCKNLKYSPGDSCGTRDVKFEADSWRTVYINIYGVVDEKEIRSLIDFTKAFRGEEYKAIPVVMTFYDGFEIRKLDNGKGFIKIQGKIVNEITLKGEK